jgi:hypothetical protein
MTSIFFSTSLRDKKGLEIKLNGEAFASHARPWISSPALSKKKKRGKTKKYQRGKRHYVWSDSNS